MPELLVSVSELDRARRFDPAALTGLERLAKLQKQQRRQRMQESLAKSWPLAAGLVLACFAPILRDIASAYDPWGMRILFPFVVLAGHKEVNFGGMMADYLPKIMLYAQFPLEGLLAKTILRGRVTFTAVAIQVMFYHFLAAAQLWLISGALGQLAKY